MINIKDSSATSPVAIPNDAHSTAGVKTRRHRISPLGFIEVYQRRRLAPTHPTTQLPTRNVPMEFNSTNLE
jgi:hypothetical protein